MEMQKALGVLGEKVSRLSSDINGMGTRVEVFGDKLDKVRHWQSVVSGGAIVIAAIAAIAWSIITFLPWDRIHIDTAPRIEAKPAATKG